MRGISIGDALLEGAPDAHNPVTTLRIAMTAIDRFTMLMYRTLAGLTALAERAESAIGLPALTAPADPQEESQVEAVASPKRSWREILAYPARAASGITILATAVYLLLFAGQSTGANSSAAAAAAAAAADPQLPARAPLVSPSLAQQLPPEETMKRIRELADARLCAAAAAAAKPAASPPCPPSLAARRSSIAQPESQCVFADAGKDEGNPRGHRDLRDAHDHVYPPTLNELRVANLITSDEALESPGMPGQQYLYFIPSTQEKNEVLICDPAKYLGSMKIALLANNSVFSASQSVMDRRISRPAAPQR